MRRLVYWAVPDNGLPLPLICDAEQLHHTVLRLRNFVLGFNEPVILAPGSHADERPRHAALHEVAAHGIRSSEGKTTVRLPTAHSISIPDKLKPCRISPDRGGLEPPVQHYSSRLRQFRRAGIEWQDGKILDDDDRTRFRLRLDECGGTEQSSNQQMTSPA
jgi:hypothetical protein